MTDEQMNALVFLGKMSLGFTQDQIDGPQTPVLCIEHPTGDVTITLDEIRALARGFRMACQKLTKAEAERDAAQMARDVNDRATLEHVERAHIESVLRSVHGNKVHAAKILDIDRRTIYRKLEKPQRCQRCGELSPACDCEDPREVGYP